MAGRGIWGWAQEAYARPGVAKACLTLQDVHHQNVCLLLWAAWSGADGARLAQGVTLARRWEAEVVAPLRHARRALKPDWPGVGAEPRLRLRQAASAAELDAERLLLEALAEIAGPAADASLAAGRLSATARAWGPPPPDAALAALASALDQDALD